MVGALVLLALGCTWSIRSDWRRPDGRTEWWELTEAFVGLLMLSMLVSSALQVLVRYLFSDSYGPTQFCDASVETCVRRPDDERAGGSIKGTTDGREKLKAHEGRRLIIRTI
jgi:hypothetical protein